jgi:catechol 2,3-dioxygenase-like lactoylglutathione lyase family enzyme
MGISPRITLPFRHDHIALTVRDLNVSRQFYESLGGRVVSLPSTAFMEIVLGEIRLHLIPAGEADVGRRTAGARIDHLCLQVASVDALLSVQEMLNEHPLLVGRARCHVEDSPPLGEGGQTHVEERPPRKTLYFEDPDGIRLEIRAYHYCER